MQNSQLNYPVTMELEDIRNTKLKLIKIAAQLITMKYKTQKIAADALKIDQPKVSQISRSRIEGFSLEYLLNLLTQLGQDVNLKIKCNSELV